MLGDSFVSGRCTHVFAESAQELEDKFAKIRIPWRPISIYAVGNRHYAWVITDMPIPRHTKKKLESVSIEEMNKELNELKK